VRKPDVSWSPWELLLSIVPCAAWWDKARKLEALGYAVLNVPDHLEHFLAPLPALVSAADATTPLRIGTKVLHNDVRHPVLVAREAATVGRVPAGCG
jgi:alkanesulfonate monooxygenase SsuD/methylene tetrahydromethanopterin reductase-like flavin-dependent oxidoreductase (luciferase family)